MATYVIAVTTTSVETYEVEADSFEEAEEIIGEGGMTPVRSKIVEDTLTLLDTRESAEENAR